MNDLLRLHERERRGSKPRCHLLTQGTPSEVASRLNILVAPFGSISASDRWMPQGFDDLEEAQLHNAPRLVEPALSMQLRDWWLEKASYRAKTPNIDIAATCTIDGKPGLLLVEAKAHDEELTFESAGRRNIEGSPDRAASHAKIGNAISKAAEGLSRDTVHEFRLSRDLCYQMSNRFAWAWKLTELGMPVVLVYLGFLKCNEMSDRGKPFKSAQDWDELVYAHSQRLFPKTIWNHKWQTNGQAFIPLIRSVEIALPTAQTN
ncbi:MAG TPA: hypothetical protein VFB54_17470 [Burkholderiales bacterium]|nr:hypothetical protein [Burkholderiales bacterium]